MSQVEGKIDDQESCSADGPPEEQKRCIVCNTVPDSIICLACGHDIAIPCAAKAILSKQDLNDIDISQIGCPLCNEVTHLSKEVQVAIIEYLQNQELEFDAEANEIPQDEPEESLDQEQDGTEEEEEPRESENLEKSAVEKKRGDTQLYRTNNNPATNLSQQKSQSKQKGKKKHAHNEQESQSSEDRDQSVHVQSENLATQASDISFHFACLNHPTEEYAYYSPSRKQLFCAQCLITDENIRKIKDLKSIRRSLPLIMQHFQDLLNNVEVSRSLLENRRKDSEIKLEDVKAKMNSIKYFVEMRYEEMIEQINDIKTSIIDRLEEKFEQMLDSLREVGDRFEAKIEYFDAVLNQVKDIQTENENSDEDLLGFFFANQTRIDTIVKEEANEEQLNRILEECQIVESNIDKEMRTEMNKSVAEISKCLNEIFKEFIPGKQVSVVAEEPENPALNRRQFLEIQSKEHRSGTRALQFEDYPYLEEIQQILPQHSYLSKVKNSPDPPNSTQNFSINGVLKNEHQTTKKATPASYHIRLPFQNRVRIEGGVSQNLATSSIKDTSGMADKFLRKFDLLKTQQTYISDEHQDPITDIEKKLSQFNLKYTKRPQSSHKKPTHPSFGEENKTYYDKSDQQVNTVESLRQFRRKMRAKLTTECLNKKNKSLFML